MSGENSNSHTRQEIGLTLERARKERGLSLQQVEQATKIRARYLRDLENENFDVLPAVYMLGSLKTYARYLGLDGEALTREFKHRQALLQEKQDQEQEEPRAGERGGLLASLGRLLGVGSLETGEDDAGTVQGPGHSPRLYLSFGVVLIFVFAIALASNLRAEDQPSVSQVSEPKLSQFPSMLALVGSPGDERNTGAENKENQSGEQARSPAKDTGKDENKDEKDKAERSGLERDVSHTAQASSFSATASASASTSASPGSTASAKAEPASVRPKPAATGEPDDTDEGMAAAATDRPSAPSARVTGGPSVQRKEAGPVNATLLGKKIKIKVKNAVRSD